MHTDSVDPFEVESERAYVVYNSRSGEIVHEHIVTNFKGGRALSPKQEQTQALKLARQFGHNARGLKVLSVDPKRLDEGARLRVHLETLKLVRDRSQEKTAAQ